MKHEAGLECTIRKEGVGDREAWGRWWLEELEKGEGGALMCSCGEGKVMAWKENVQEVGFGASMEMLGGGDGERKGIRKRLGWRRREEEQRRRRS